MMVGTHIMYHWKDNMLIFRYMLVIEKGFLRGLPVGLQKIPIKKKI